MEGNSIKGLVIKNIANLYTVFCEDAGGEGVSFLASAQGKLKQSDKQGPRENISGYCGKVLVGDHVEFDKLADGGEAITVCNANITKVYPRKNVLIRPPISNIDCLVIMVTKSPSPDFVLVDKLIINCMIHNIKPILCISKTDTMTEQEIEQIISGYKNVVDDIVCLSSQNRKNLEQLTSIIKNQITALAGQSAVGKSTLLNALLGTNIKTDGLSAKVDRGKHTTRHTEIFLHGNIRIADTPGFSLIDLKVDETELRYYYSEFEAFNCKYRGCMHINEDEGICAVKQAVKTGKINKDRYERYIKIFQELKKRGLPRTSRSK